MAQQSIEISKLYSWAAGKLSKMGQGEDLRRHQRQRPAHPDLDSLDRPVAPQVAAPPLQGRVVLVQPRDDVAPEPLYLSRSHGLVARSLRDATHWPGPRTARTAVTRTWTAERDSRVDLNPENRPCPRYEPEMTRRETSPASYFGQQCSILLKFHSFPKKSF